MTAAENPAETSEQGRKTRKTWHYLPELPIQVSPYFNWPPNPLEIVKWFFRGWIRPSEKLFILLISILCWFYWYPSLSEAAELSAGWIISIYLRNLLLLILVAGGLHTWFYIWKKQGDELRFDSRPLVKNSRVFTFNNQVHDNIFWSCVSGVSIWTAYEVFMLWLLANGLIPSLNLPDDWPILLLLIALLPAWETVHFFLIHRLIHWPPLYRRIHSLHHRNTNTGPWSGFSMHPIEHLLYLSTVLIHFVVPLHPLLLIFHLQYFALSAATTHTGYQGLLINGRLVLPLGNFHHQLHHRFFECNYGGLEIPMDKWTGNFHDGTDESHQAFLRRRRSAPG